MRMKVQDLLDMVAENPEIADYTFCLSEYLSVPDEASLDDENLPLIFVTDFPCLAIAANDDDKEIRLIMKQSDFSLIEQTPDRILKILRKVREENGI